MKYRVKIEYDGTDYIGWQKQPDQPNKSIEELVENAIYAMTAQRAKINCAGRTDSGVHALGQVADFALDKEFSERRILMALNQYLINEKVSIIDCKIVDDSFHSRYDAISRSYVYRIVNRSAKLTLDKNKAWHVPVPLDETRMQQAANFLIGEHDFTSFRDSKCQSNTPVKKVNYISVTRSQDRITISVNAKSFLHHMVRNIVGTLYLAGTSQVEPISISDVLKAKDRTASGQNAPAHGLYFLEAKY